MNHRAPLRLTLIAAALGLMAVACAPSGDTGTGDTTTSTMPTTVAPTTSTTPPSVFSAELTMTIGTAEQPAEFEATLDCGEEDHSTGYLAGRAAPACAFLEASSEAQQLLVEGPASDRACTEIYGGGEIAEVDGTLSGHQVTVAIDRANGCGIADWDLLQPILVEPYDLARLNARAACSGAGPPIRDEVDTNLPTLVAEVRMALLNGATSCDLEGLATRALADGTNVSFGGSGDPAGLWRDLESSGATPMADLSAVLRLSPGTTDDGQGTTFYVWPAVAAMDDWNDATDEQRSELADLFGDEALVDWDLFGGYIGYRVGITDSGRWAFFVQGD